MAPHLSDDEFTGKDDAGHQVLHERYDPRRRAGLEQGDLTGHQAEGTWTDARMLWGHSRSIRRGENKDTMGHHGNVVTVIKDDDDDDANTPR